MSPYLLSLINSPVFRDVDVDYIAFLLEQPKSIISLEKDTYLFKQGEIGHALYVIISGELQILIESNKKWIVIDTISDKVSLGEMSVVTSLPRTASVKATEDCVLFHLSATTFKDHTKAGDVNMLKVSYNIFTILAKRLANTNQILLNVNKPTSSEIEQYRHRLAKELLL